MLGERGAAGFRALLDGFPEPVGLLWAIRNGGEVVDFAFGYGNPAMVSGLPDPGRDARPLHAPRGAARACAAAMRSTRTSRCATAASRWVSEVTYDTPFGDGYMLGTFLHRAARIGDGVIVFLHDVTASGGWRPS